VWLTDNLPRWVEFFQGRDLRSFEFIESLSPGSLQSDPRPYSIKHGAFTS
jgi:hypothetical protein